MKSRERNRSISQYSLHTYLKPGALAQLRNSKIIAKSKELDSQALFALCELKNLDLASSQLNQPAMDGIPIFSMRIKKNYPRCILRKKLIAVTPIFSEAES